MPLSSLFSRVFSAFGTGGKPSQDRGDSQLTRLYLVFGTGRCGTSLLAQYFGGVAENQRDWRRAGEDLVAHEPFESVDVFWDRVKEAKRGEKTSFVEKVLLPALERQGNCRYCLLTDNKLGRWFVLDALEYGIDTRVIYVHRTPEDVLPSLRKCTVGMETLYWCYEPTDVNTIVKEEDPHLFHIKETAKQWERLRAQLEPHQYLEVSFERFISDRSHRREVEQFFNMQGNEHLIERKTNATETNYKI